MSILEVCLDIGSTVTYSATDLLIKAAGKIIQFSHDPRKRLLRW
jgi:hypothetical protein